MLQVLMGVTRPTLAAVGDQELAGAFPEHVQERPELPEQDRFPMIINRAKQVTHWRPPRGSPWQDVLRDRKVPSRTQLSTSGLVPPTHPWGRRGCVAIPSRASCTRTGSVCRH